MARSTVKCPDITIGNGTQVSQVIRLSQIHEDCDAIALLCNQVDAVPTYKIQICETEDGTGNWDDFTDGTNLIIPPGASKAAVYPFLNFTFRILASQNVGSTCTWKMFKVYSVFYH